MAIARTVKTLAFLAWLVPLWVCCEVADLLTEEQPDERYIYEELN